MWLESLTISKKEVISFKLNIYCRHIYDRFLLAEQNNKCKTRGQVSDGMLKKFFCIKSLRQRHSYREPSNWKLCKRMSIKTDKATRSKRQHCMKKRIFVLQKFVKRTEKISFSSAFVCFRFSEISYFLNFPSNENVRKQHLSANAYFCVNMTFSYTIAGRKDEIVVL